MSDYRSTKGEKPPATGRERRSLRVRVFLTVSLGSVLILAAGHWIRLNRRVPASGYVTTSDYAEVRAPVAGQVTRIAVSSGAQVKQGDLLVQLEDAAERALLAEAESELQRSQAELALREAELAEERRDRACRVAAAALSLEHARKRLETTRQLSEKGLASGRDLMDDTYRVQLAEAEHQRLQAYDATLGERQIAVLRQTAAARQEAVARARANLAARAILAPAAGRLLRHTFYVGEVVRPEMVLYEVFGGDELILKLRVPERYATRVATNQQVRAQLRSEKTLLLRHWLYGHVAAVRDAIQSDGQQTYRVIYCPFDPRGLEVPPGTTADAQVRVGRASIWQILFDL
ncbi:MAG: HlyD family efflux transporter periplasmic adaptor subunit [Kiritimatiellae bacterium]|nr:HlyD family efflux transporter periplasmic adaptor subunit [Kiritimatiellia bacterium]